MFPGYVRLCLLYSISVSYTHLLASRIDHFDAAGCRASDHGLDYVIYRPADRAAVAMVFSKGMNGEALTVEAVSYTHLDVYKRQVHAQPRRRAQAQPQHGAAPRPF